MKKMKVLFAQVNIAIFLIMTGCYTSISTDYEYKIVDLKDSSVPNAMVKRSSNLVVYSGDFDSDLKITMNMIYLESEQRKDNYICFHYDGDNWVYLNKLILLLDGLDYEILPNTGKEIDVSYKAAVKEYLEFQITSTISDKLINAKNIKMRLVGKSVDYDLELNYDIIKKIQQFLIEFRY